MMDEKPNMPSTRYPPNTIYIIRARVRAREMLALQQHHAQRHTPFPPAKTQTIAHNFYLP